MRRSIRTGLAVLAVTGGVVATMGSPAFAGKPLVFEQGEFDETFVIPGGVGFCDFDVQGRDTGSFKTTVFFDRDGETRLAKNHANGTTYWSLPDGDVVAVDRWVNNSFFELAPGSGPETPPLSQTTVGNPWNVHGGAGGVLVNDSGRVVFDGDGNIVSVNGPHQALFGEFGDLCDALAASGGG
jgi:hypothetical protein